MQIFFGDLPTSFMNCIIIIDEEMARAIIAQLRTDYSDLKLQLNSQYFKERLNYLNSNEVNLIFFRYSYVPDFTEFD
jgi:hypothetical protein